jgi:hypothetical protein
MQGDHAMDVADPITPLHKELQALYLRVSPAFSALRLWERVLSEQDRAHLGGDFGSAYAELGTVGIWMKLRGVSPERALIDVAKKIGFITDETQEFLLRGIGDITDDPEAAIIEAAADGALVLVERPRAAYWKQEKLQVDWDAHPALWGYLFELCRNAKAGRPIDRLSFGDNFREDYFVKQKSRLSNVESFPPSLIDLIKPAGRGAQRLDIPPAQIRIFELVTTETLRERMA